MKRATAISRHGVFGVALLLGSVVPQSISAVQPAVSATGDEQARVLDAQAAEAYDSGDTALAATLWRQAAQAGDRDAMTALGALLEEGDGVPANLELAREWYLRAADRGEPHAMVLIAIERLSHDPADPRGLSLMNRAAALGHDFAKRRLASLSGNASANSDDSTGDDQ